MGDFEQYVNDFNAENDDGLIDKWFADPFVYEGGERTIEGLEAWRGFLHYAHNGVSEIFRPITSFDGPNGHFCEIDMDFHAWKPRPDFPFGPLQPGDMYTVKFFVVYESNGSKFTRLKAATWPVNQRVSQLPRLGSHVTQRAGFRAFKAALAHEDGANAAQYLADDVQVAGSDGTAPNQLSAIAKLREAGISGATLVSAADDALLVEVAEERYRLTLRDGLIQQVDQV